MEEKAYTISEFIEIVNNALRSLQSTIVGEVSEMKTASSGHAYFTLKDKDTGDILPCVMWRSRYSLCGVEIEVGMELQLKGRPEFYGGFGKMSFIADSVELVGDGALKKAYEKLRKKLEAEGLFESSRKRPLPLFPQKVGVITSVHGAVIHDFSNNLRKSGFQVKILDCRVEGPESGRSLTLSVRAMRKEDIDVLVLIRGGGSIQSLAGFDNEALVREIAKFPVPVITGIGHHQDIPLATLVADATESTPSLVAALLGRSWTEAERTLERSQNRVLEAYREALRGVQGILDSTFEKAKESLDGILDRYEEAKNAVKSGFSKIEARITGLSRDVSDAGQNVVRAFDSAISDLKTEYFSHIPTRISTRYSTDLRGVGKQIESLVRLIDTNNPERQLKLGYSIAFSGGKVVRSIKDTSVGQPLEVRVMDGEILSEVKGIK